MEIIQDLPAIVNETYIERAIEQQTVEEQFPYSQNASEKNRFHTKFKLIEYSPNKKNSKKTVFSGLLKNYPEGIIQIPDNTFEQDKKYNLRIISPLGNTTYNIPDEIVSEKIKNSSGKKQTLEFHLFNDNTGISLIDKILPGDDLGYTCGSKISYGIDFEKHHLNIDYLANLYTRKMNGPVTFSEKGDVFWIQNFLDEISLTATLSNKQQRNPLYQDYSLGFLSLSSSNNDFFLKASTQQKIWHNFLSNFVPIFLPDNQETLPPQFGIVFGFHQGLYLPVRIFDWLNFSMDFKIGGRLSTIPQADYFDFATSADLTVGKPESFMAKINFSSDTLLHHDGSLTILSLGPSIETEGFQFGINFLKPLGDSFSMYKFDDKRTGKHASIGYDLIGETFVKFKF